MNILERRLASIEKVINPDPKDRPEARICVYDSGDVSQAEAIGQHCEKYGRMPVIAISAKRPLDI